MTVGEHGDQQAVDEDFLADDLFFQAGFEDFELLF